LCATAMPLGLNTVVFPAAYGGDTTPGAGMALVSHLISVITIPVMFSIFI
ncbi:MAG TPA: permease, partial [Ruminococcaceae bacterium]|nr:permease [Oscillospiraceae bacterium]